jgi:hypothetical protein
VDGYVEAPNASQAIDRLADRGIIGVYSVRPEPKPPKNAVRLDGEPEPEEAKPVARIEAPAPPPPPAPVKSEPGAEVVFASLVDKLGTLLVQVEKLLSRPQQQVIYQSAGPARDRGDFGSARIRKPHPNPEGSSTLRDIFQTNLDLRQSLEKLANNTGTASRMSEAVAKVGEAATRLTDAAVESKVAELKTADADPVEPMMDTGQPPQANGPDSREAANRDSSGRESSGRDSSGREPSIGRGLINAQPAA